MRDRTIIGFENEKRTTITGGYEFLTDSDDFTNQYVFCLQG